ncbi:hypothetical protein [Myxococcus landrumensis]|uniref:Uncharacterized protein n=1 Tax=Myxococcus landrumensis TaxID=2813577 RepID=A0ABX7N2R9_9BACT|nr:hypothetical protein [Myxococcus landrumus]QSQ12918.1 hypothetical protein JY572_31905 [Myxococcus landrumus]
MAASEERRLQALVLAPVRRVRRRLNALAWTEAGLAPAWATVTACVLARMLLRGHLVLALPPLILAGLAWWWVRARARGVSLEYAAVLADRSAQAGGLLLTRLERPVGEWELTVNQLAREVKLPELPWRRPVAALVGALLFLLVGFLLPLPALRGARPVHAAAAAKVDAVQAQAEALAREEPLGEAVEEELRRLAEEVAAGRFDSGDWEAADSLEQRLAERAAEAAAHLSKAAEAARDLEDALGAAGGAESASREREALERALMELGDAQSGTEEQAAASNPGSREGTEGQSAEPNTGTQSASREGTQGQANPDSREGTQGQANPGSREGTQGQANTGSREGSESGESSAQRAQARARSSGSVDQISDLRQSLERRRQSLSQPFDSRQGENAQANSRRSGARGQQEGSRGARQGARSQGQQGQGQQGEGPQGDGQGDGQGRSEGQGGPRGARSGQGHASRAVESRTGSNEAGTGAEGGGHNPLVFGGGAEMDPERLAFEPLPEGQGGEAGELWGLQAADPLRSSGTMGAGGSRGTSAQGEATEGPGAQPLLPRNRELVKRYFGGK